MVIYNIGMFQSSREQLGKRIDNAHKALHQFNSKRNSWGYNYWQRVLDHLSREWRRDINEFTVGINDFPRGRPSRSRILQ